LIPVESRQGCGGMLIARKGIGNSNAVICRNSRVPSRFSGENLRVA
jgi:hypothetical protein